MNVDQGNGFIEVQGIKCWLPKQPAKHLIQNYDLPKKKQKWERTLLPTFRAADIEWWSGQEHNSDDEVEFEDACREEHIKRYGTDPLDLDRQQNEKRVPGVEADPDYSMECLNPFRDQELDRIINGHWIYIKGDVYYLPGVYYFYLNYWSLLDGYAEFRYTDLELFYFWESVKKSMNLFGILYITMRGIGKSYVAGCISYHAAITQRKARTAIQSINDQAAADFFRDKIIMPVTQLPSFLIPINKHGRGDWTGNATLEFTPGPRKGIPVLVYNEMKKSALYSKMQYNKAMLRGADGGTWTVIVGDEVGKILTATVDVYARTAVNHFTVYRGSKKIGNQFLCSTVGEMKDGGENCLRLFNDSDHTKLNAAHSTNTGLARFFRSALDATFFDDYGFPIRYTEDPETMEYLVKKYGPGAKHGAKPFHDAQRESRKNDQRSLLLYKQENPYNPEEAFFINAENCIYNAEILLTAKDRILNSGKNFVRHGNIVWKEKDKCAMFTEDNQNPRWQISFFDFEQNQVRINEGSNKTFTPLCAHKRVIGVDPYSVRDLADDRAGSNGAAAVYNRYDINIPEEFSETLIGDYLFRPPDPFSFYEDMICAAFFFGCPIFIETNKSNALDYFRMRGYMWGHAANPNDFIWERPRSTFTKETMKDTDGMYNSQGTIEHYTNTTALHVTQNGHKLKHIRVIDQWLKFNPQNTKAYDLGVAASMSLVAAERKAIANLPIIDIGSLFRTFNNSGSSSTQN